MSRDVLAPPLQRMGPNRCYRVNLVHEDFGGQPQFKQRMQQPSGTEYTESDLYKDDDDNGSCDEDDSCTIEELPNAMLKLTMHVAPAFYGGLIGFKGSTKRRIETETQTTIFVPRSREGAKAQPEDLVIKGKERSNLLSARRKINLLVSSLRGRMRPTHFLCVAFRESEITEKYVEFKKQVLALGLPGIAEDLFQAETNIHLTLTVCVLLDDAERTAAVELLQSCRVHLNDLKLPFEVKVKGLEIMNDDPSAVRVLYGKVEAPDLQTFADRVLATFKPSGFVPERERDTVKMHMTVMNNRYRANNAKGGEKAARNFDAREILKQLSDFDFGSAQCNEVLLCVLSSSGENRGFYKITGALKI